MLTFVAGFAVGTIMTLAVLFVGARFAGDCLDQLSDQGADEGAWDFHLERSNTDAHP